VQMIVVPAHEQLDDPVQVRNRQAVRERNPAPNGGMNVTTPTIAHLTRPCPRFVMGSSSWHASAGRARRWHHRDGQVFFADRQTVTGLMDHPERRDSRAMRAVHSRPARIIGRERSAARRLGLRGVSEALGQHSHTGVFL
jgi:hypothetical protein